MNFQANFYKLTRTGRISTRSSLESPRAPRALTCACENFQDPVPRRSNRRTTISPQPVSCDDVGAGLIMSPTRNRNFVRRVLDKNEAPDSRCMYAAASGSEEGAREDLEPRTRERGTCYFGGHEAEARLHAVTHRSSRGSFRARGSSPTAVGMGFLLWPRAPARLKNAWARSRSWAPTSRRLIRAIIIVCWFAFPRSSLSSFLMAECHLNFRVENNNHHNLPSTCVNLSVRCNVINFDKLQGSWSQIF